MADGAQPRFLGDVGANAPQAWLWGGPDSDPVDLLLLLYGEGRGGSRSSPEPHLEALGRRARAAAPRRSATGTTSASATGSRSRSSPASATGPAEHVVTRRVCARVSERVRPAHRSPAVTAAADPGAVLPPDPAGRRRATSAATARSSSCARCSRTWPGSGSSHVARPAGATVTPVALAAKMVGRWPSGAPARAPPDRDDPAHATANGFGYARIDPDGLRCPIGAHVRRSQPARLARPQPRHARLDRRQPPPPAPAARPQVRAGCRPRRPARGHGCRRRRRSRAALHLPGGEHRPPVRVRPTHLD